MECPLQCRCLTLGRSRGPLWTGGTGGGACCGLRVSTVTSRPVLHHNTVVTMDTPCTPRTLTSPPPTHPHTLTTSTNRTTHPLQMPWQQATPYQFHRECTMDITIHNLPTVATTCEVTRRGIPMVTTTPVCGEMPIPTTTCHTREMMLMYRLLQSPSTEICRPPRGERDM